MHDAHRNTVTALQSQGPLALQAGVAPKAPAKSHQVTQEVRLAFSRKQTIGVWQLDLYAKIAVDGNDVTEPKVAAETAFVPPSYTVYKDADPKTGKLTKLRIRWAGAFVIQTHYRKGLEPDKVLSGYGRGTTAADVRAGDISLSFHESCHRADLDRYLLEQALPNPPSLAAGMAIADYDTAMKLFDQALRGYIDAALNQTARLSDEVGYTKSTWKLTDKPFEHRRATGG